MNNLLYAMDNNFWSSLGRYDFIARCEMIKDLGIDATYLTLHTDLAEWEDLNLIPTLRPRFQIECASLCITLDLAYDEYYEPNKNVMRLLDHPHGCRTIELTMRFGDKSRKSSDPEGDEIAIGWLRKLLPIAERNGITIAIYPHIWYWLERTEDAVRLCQKVNHPNLKIVFSGFHWCAVDGKKLFDRLQDAGPFLHRVNICGTRRMTTATQGLPATIEPLDEGELDNFALLCALNRLNFQGMIGIMGVTVGGDCYMKLKRSVTAYRDMVRRIKKHPHWGNIRMAI